jgi:hypothetical protein
MCVLVFKTRKPPPEQPPSLREMIRTVVQLGGFLGRKCDAEPGTQSSKVDCNAWRISPPPSAVPVSLTRWLPEPAIPKRRAIRTPKPLLRDTPMAEKEDCLMQTCGERSALYRITALASCVRIPTIGNVG